MTHILENISSWIKRQERIQRTRRELSQLSDRELSDIGITRCDIDSVSKKEPINVAI